MHNLTTPRLLSSLLFLFLSGGCTHFTTLPKTCGSAPNSDICIGKMEIPEEKTHDFTLAGQLAINAVYSEEFERTLERCMEQRLTQGPLPEDWEKQTARSIVSQLREQVPQLSLVTYGGISGAWLYVFYGNLAFDGAPGLEPIRVNRWGLWRPPESFANTIVHEAAHKIGLSHFSENRVCDPPYVIGSIVERLAIGPKWTWTSEHCDWLAACLQSKSP